MEMGAASYSTSHSSTNPNVARHCAVEFRSSSTAPWRVHMTGRRRAADPQLHPEVSTVPNWHAVRIPAALLSLAAVAALAPATAGADIGSSSVGSTVDYNTPGRAQDFKLTAGSTASLTRLSIYLDKSSTGSKVELGLFSGSTSASKRLARCVITAPTAGAWNRCTFTAVKVTKSTTYWLGVLQPTGTTGTVKYREAASGSRTYGSSSTALTALPSTWSNGPDWGTAAASIYADVAPATTPPPVTTPPVTSDPTPPVTTPPVTDPTPPVTNPTPPVTDPTPPASSCTVNATTSTFASAFANAAGGSTICLASGNYGTFTGGSKSSQVTIKPASGASVSIQVNFGSNVNNVRLDGIQDLGGWVINGSKNVAITNSKFTYPTSVLGTVTGLVFDGDTFDNLPQGTWEGRLSFSQSANGATVKNSHFGNGGCSDGIQITGSSSNILIQGNEFSNLTQGSCSQHVDPIQFYGASNVTVDSNYFHDTSTGIMSPDGNGSPFTITNNVFVGTSGGYPWAIVDGGGKNDVISHNTIVGGWVVEVGQANGGQSASNETVKDNIFTNGVSILSPQPASSVLQDYNLNGSGSHSLSGTPTYSGGSKPTTYAGYKLASGSVGAGKASDGKNMGIN